jgi:protein ImuB
MKRIACIHLNAADGNSPIEQRQSEIAECCGCFSPLVGFEPTDPQSVLLDVTGLTHLFGGEAAMVEAIVHDLATLGFTGRAAVADTIGAAWAAVHYCKEEIANVKFEISNCKFQICNFQSFAFLLSLPIESLRLSPDTLRLLHELGLTCVGQLEAIPREEFLSRFGPGLLRRMDQAFGRLDEPLPAYPLPPKFEVRWSAEHPTARHETIAAVLERLIARVAALLARCGRGVLRLDCRLDQLPLSVGLFQPTADAKRLFELVELQLQRLRIASPVTAICVTASLHAPLEPRRQATLFELDDDSRQPRHLAALIERLASRLGSRAVLGVRLRPEAQPEFAWRYDPLVGRRRKPAATVSRRSGVSPLRAAGWHALKGRGHGTPDIRFQMLNEQLPSELPPRPLRLLPRPLPLAVTSLAPDGPPLRFQLGGREFMVAHSWGPERIETGWWRGQAIGRDYFHIETAAGGRYWLFRRLRDGKWFLHGTFE